MKFMVTGAGGALGAATAALLDRQGHEVARIVRNSPSQDPRTIACEDLADTQSAERSVGAAVKALGSLDGVLHMAGAFDWRPVAHSDATLWQALFRKNLETTLAVVKATLPCLGAGGAIVTIGAAAAEPSGAGMAPYAASKSAVAKLTQSLAAELDEGRIRITPCCLPSSTRRPIGAPCRMRIHRAGPIPTPSRKWRPSWCRLPPAPYMAPLSR